MMKNWFKRIMDQEPDDLLGGGGGTPPVEPPAEPPAPELPDWANGVEFPEGLDANIISDPSLHAFVGEDKKLNYGNMIKSYVHAQKQIGKDKIVVPGKDASPEQWNDIFKKLGLPDSEDKYELSIPKDESGNFELKEDFVNDFKKSALEAGILPQQAQKILDFYQGKVKTALENADQGIQQSREAAVEELKKDWGEKFESNLKLANTALSHFGGEEVVGKLKELGLTNDPVVAKFLAKVGGTLSDDVIRDAGGSNTGDEPGTLESQIEELQAHPAYFDTEHAEHAIIKNKANKLYARLYK